MIFLSSGLEKWSLSFSQKIDENGHWGKWQLSIDSYGRNRHLGTNLSLSKLDRLSNKNKRNHEVNQASFLVTKDTKKMLQG